MHLARNILIAAAALAATCGTSRASQLSLDAATGFNVFTLSNFTMTGTDTYGKMAVGGDFNPGSSSYTIASQSSDGAGTFDLIVGGNFYNNYNSINGGDMLVLGNAIWTGPTAAHNIYVDGNFSNPGWGTVNGTVYYGGTYSSAGTLTNQKLASPVASPVNFSTAATNLKSLAAQLAAQTQNGTVSSAYNVYTLTGTNNGINVFNLTDTSYSGSTVIINVAGTSDSFNAGSVNLSGVSAGNVIFNFSSATSLSLSSIAFYGTVLAPYAAFSGTNGSENGQLIVNSATGNMEIHSALFSGSLPAGQQGSATPEPSTWIMMLTGAGAIVWFRKRFRSQTAAA